MSRILAFAVTASLAFSEPYNTFDGPGHPTCNDVAGVYDPSTAANTSTPCDTMCSDDPSTIIIRTENVNQIANFSLEPSAEDGSVVIEAGVTFFQLADYLHQRNASIGYALVSWNITLAASVAMGAHRSSLRQDSMVASGALEVHIIDGSGNIRVVKRDENDDQWLAASTSLGLLGVIARMKFKIYLDFKVYADQKILAENDVLNGDIYGLIFPYATANFWCQQGFQSTFSVTKTEADTALGLLNAGANSSFFNSLAETTFFSLWSFPNFREKTNNLPLITCLVLKRIREAFDYELEVNGKQMTSTYRSGINIKFGKPYFDLLGQVTYGTADGADWSKGAMMFDFPTFRPTVGDGKRFNEPFYPMLATTLVNEFPCRPHWTKNIRGVFEQSKKNIDPDHLARFKVVKDDFDS
ncbi:hypothetical protein BDV96DRAFT_617857 [Lophiotrema nucula]|uniref:FAD-binding PCMH-type domain-containing protein n=1 Tax=Lophiotrema nucula TaxID=690887 RepID=A0A6A5YE29_9PLEO|nr:hypothetical protein BDV96DRAFT_617857 [Lophiotrema nucula]